MWTNYGHMGWGSGAGGMFGFAPMALWWVILIVAAVMLVRWLVGASAGRRSSGVGAGREILAERYARGEIDRDEFQKRRRDLGI